MPFGIWDRDCEFFQFREHCSPALAHGLFSSLSRLHEPELGLELRAPPWAPQLPAPPQVCGAVTAPCAAPVAAPTPPQAAHLPAPPSSVRCPSPCAAPGRPAPCAAPVAAPCAAPVASVAWEFKRGLGDSDPAIQAWEAATQAWEGAWEQS